MKSGTNRNFLRQLTSEEVVAHIWAVVHKNEMLTKQLEKAKEDIERLRQEKQKLVDRNAQLSVQVRSRKK